MLDVRSATAAEVGGIGISLPDHRAARNDWNLIECRARKTIVHSLDKKVLIRRKRMKIWTKPAVREQEVGLEVTSYLPAEIDVI